MELVADTAHYRGRAKLDRVVFSIAPDFTAATTKLFAGEADFFEVLRPEQLPELAKNASLKAVPYSGLDVGFLLFNQRDPAARARPHPVLGDRQVRRALTMALDRETMVRSVLDSFGSVPLGPFVRAQSGADTTLPRLAYDPARAAALLDSAGWRDTDGDGMREKGGRPLGFSLIVPNSSKNRMRYAVLIQDQLKRAGVAVKIEELEFGTFAERQMKRKFDAVMDGRHLDPSPTVLEQSWGSAAARATESSNYSSYANATFDALLDSAGASADPAKSRAYLSRAYRTIIEDAPAAWLYEPRMVAGAHKRIQISGMRADAWWAGIADWTIPAGERIPRDRIGLPAAGSDSAVRVASGSR
jgi:peptide/nickel transport system substrate-binding protein